MTEKSIYRFRLHWALEPGQSINDLNGATCVTLPGIGNCEIKEICYDPNTKTHEFSLTGPLSNSKESAMMQGQCALGSLLILSLTNGFAVQLQHRTPPPIIFKGLIEAIGLQNSSVETVYPDKLGLTVFQESNDTKFVGMRSPEVLIDKKLKTFIDQWNTSTPTTLCLRKLIAYELYASSRFESSSRARFLLLVMTIEALAIQESRSNEEQLLIDTLLEQVSCSTLQPQNRTALADGLVRLKKISIGESCKRLIRRAIDATAIKNVNAAKEFGNHYRTRGKIVHGGKSPPAAELVTQANSLESTVRELLVWELSQLPTDESNDLWQADFATILSFSDALFKNEP